MVHDRRRQAALTVAELLVALALGAVLARAAVLQAAGLLGAIRLPLAARRLATDLHVVRATSVLRNSRARVTFTDDRYTTRYEIGVPRTVEAVLAPGIRVARRPRSGALQFFPTGCAENGTVVLTTAAGSERSVVVNQRGRIAVR